MHGLSRVVGAGTTITIDGKQYVLGSFDLEDWGKTEAYLTKVKRKEKLSVVIELRDMLPPDEWHELFQDARREAEAIREVSPEEVFAWIETREGLSFVFFLLLEKSYPGQFSIETMTKVILSMSEADRKELQESHQQAAGLDGIKNATSPTQDVPGTT